MIIIKEIIKIYDIEFSNKTHNKVIAEVEIKVPMAIVKKENFISRLLKPAIKLPVHTPVSGKGTATKPASAKYFFILECLLSI